MKLTQKLLGYLNRVFDKDPRQVLALRLQYDGTGMTWTVADGALTTTVVGGSGAALSVDLSIYSVAQLGVYLAAQPGYSVPYADNGTFTGLSALVLIDGSASIATSNGDHLYGYTSVLWAYLESVGSELKLIRSAIAEALLQMSANTASGEWVDVHGVYYDVLRNQGEADAQYAARIVSEVLQARGNNVAIGESIKIAIGATAVTVSDYTTLTTASNGVKSYGLFDVIVDSTTDTVMADTQDSLTRQVVEAMRDAGTFMRKLKYIRRSPWLAYAGCALSAGENVTVGFGGIPLLSDGSAISDGTYISNGYKLSV